ncbi:MAG: DNA adenine methylase [Bacteroidota bacterium]
MILTRIGNKRRIANKIIPLFPYHKMYIEPFFGAGGMFFSKQKVKYNIVNDLDNEVFNLFMVTKSQKSALETAFLHTPYNEELFRYWAENQEIEPIQKAVRFLFLSNFGFLGKSETLKFGYHNSKQVIIDKLNDVNQKLQDVQFMNCCFRKVLSKVNFRHGDNDREHAFIYADPPYLETDDNYSASFEFQDSIDLFDMLEGSDVRFAMSEFDHPFILDEAKKRKLNIINVGERVNLKNRRLEILITNYRPQNLLF